MNVPKPPAEDPRVKALREMELRRSEIDRTKSIQDQLAVETRMRGGGGLRGLFGMMGGARGFIRSLLGSG